MGWIGCERCHLAELGIVIICEMSASERERGTIPGFLLADECKTMPSSMDSCHSYTHG